MRDSDTDGYGAGAGENRAPAIILSLVIGFLGIIFLSFFVHWYEVGVMSAQQPPQIIVNALPPIVLFMMVILTMALNPLLKLISRNLALGAREMFIVLTLWLVAGVISYTNFTSPALSAIGNTYSTAVDRPVITRVGLRDHLNPRLFLTSHAANEYNQGKSPDGRTRIPPIGASVLFRAGEFRDVGGFAIKAREGDDPLSRYLRLNMDGDVRRKLENVADSFVVLSDSMLDELNSIVAGPMLYDEAAFGHITLPDRIRGLIEIAPEGPQLVTLNRLLLEAAFTSELERASETGPWELKAKDIRDLPGIAAKVYERRDGVSRLVFERMTPEGADNLRSFFDAAAEAVPMLVRELNSFVEGPLLLGNEDLVGVSLSGVARARVNRLLLEISFPDKIRRSAAPVSWPFVAEEIEDEFGLAERIAAGHDPLSIYLRGRLSEETIDLTSRGYEALSPEEREKQREALLRDLNRIVTGELIYESARFADLEIDEGGKMLLNRSILEEGYSRELVRYATAIPWRLWFGPLSFWMPFLILVIIFSMSLVRMMHRQWSKHELLTYPLAEVMDSFLRREKEGVLPDVFRSRTFWIGFVAVFMMYTINGLSLYFPLMIRIPTVFQHGDLLREFDFLARYSGREAYALFRGFLYPFIIAIAVLLPTDISLSSWLGFVAMIFATGFYFLLSGDTITEPDFQAIRIGMSLALGTVIIVVGRREYLNILKHALIFQKSRDEAINRASWACRLLLLASAGLVAMLVIAGADWFISILVVMSFGLMVLLMARVTAETGIPWLNNFNSFAMSLPISILGPTAIGPQSTSVVFTTTLPMDADASNSIQAQETIYNKNRETYESGWLSNTRFNLILATGIFVALSATIFFQLWNNYTFGARRGAIEVGARMNSAATQIDRLNVEGMYDQAMEKSGLGRLANFEYNGRFWNFAIAGVIVVAIVALMRLRFSWWPFHPLPLIFVNTWAMSRLYTSIFIGWVIKAALLRVWGGKTFGKMKPFFIGVIVGQAAVLGVWILIGTIYYLMKDILPPRFLHGQGWM